MNNTAKQCRLGLFQDSDFAGDLEDSKSTSGGTLCIFGSHTFVPMSWMCKKQTAVLAQFNRIRNHFLGYWIEIGWFACSRIMGSDCFSLRTMIERGNPLFAVTQVTRKASNLEECSMFCIMLTVFPQTSNFCKYKLCCMWLNSTKQ